RGPHPFPTRRSSDLDADELLHRRWCFIRRVGGDKQKPLSILPPNEIRLTFGERESLLLALAHHERHDHTTFEMGERQQERFSLRSDEHTSELHSPTN